MDTDNLTRRLKKLVRWGIISPLTARRIFREKRDAKVKAESR